jgi:site-specific recombinase XerD
MPTYKHKRKKALTLSQVTQLCQQAKTAKAYKHPLLSKKLGLRDAALIATLYVFGKRISETLSLTRDDLWIESNNLYVRFYVLKKRPQSRLVCPVCFQKSRMTNRFCKHCGTRLTNSQGTPDKSVTVITAPRKPLERIKHKSLSYPLLHYILEWLKLVDIESKLTKEETYIFSPAIKELNFLNVQAELNWSKRISSVSAWKTIKAYAFDLFPHFFRHSLASNMSARGYDEQDLLDWFDWESYDTARGYIELAGGKRVDKMAKADF